MLEDQQVQNIQEKHIQNIQEGNRQPRGTCFQRQAIYARPNNQRREAVKGETKQECWSQR
jgi:hypothetical protein